MLYALYRMGYHGRDGQRAAVIVELMLTRLVVEFGISSDRIIQICEAFEGRPGAT